MVTHTYKDYNIVFAERGQPVRNFADESAAIDDFARSSVERRARTVGEKYGLQYAEAFHYIGPPSLFEEDPLPPSMRL